MTRINTLPPAVLTNQQLMAEYRELPRIFTAVHANIAAGKTPADFDIPDRYVLGRGHVKFFYDKIGWLTSRYAGLYVELRQHRGFDLDGEKFTAILKNADTIGGDWRQVWRPTPEDHALNMARLTRRSKSETVLAEMAGEND